MKQARRAAPRLLIVSPTIRARRRVKMPARRPEKTADKPVCKTVALQDDWLIGSPVLPPLEPAPGQMEMAERTPSITAPLSVDVPGLTPPVDPSLAAPPGLTSKMPGLPGLAELPDGPAPPDPEAMPVPKQVSFAALMACLCRKTRRRCLPHKATIFKADCDVSTKFSIGLSSKAAIAISRRRPLTSQLCARHPARHP